MIEAGVPGMRSNVAAIRPPDMPPTYIPTNMVIALTLSIKNVKGNVRVISIVAVKPGIEPIIIPDATPTKSNDSGRG
jgi:hypothetical protein